MHNIKFSEFRYSRKFVCGIPVANNFNRNNIQSRCKHHSESNSHILACSKRAKIPDQNSLVNFFDENEAVNIEPTVIEIQNRRLEEKRVLIFIENRLKPKFPWCQLSDGKLSCKVRNIQYRLYANRLINTVIC